MNFLLQRFSDNRKSTLGLLFKKIVDGTGPRLVLQAYTLEDEFQPSKIKGETRIPAGTYELVIQKLETPMTDRYQAKYPWFKNHIMLKDVPGFVGIYVHIGNTDKDSDGCILLGDSADNNVVAPGAISSSTVAFARWYNIVFPYLEGGGKSFIEIRDEKSLL